MKYFIFHLEFVETNFVQNSKQKTKKRTKKVSVDDDVTYNGGSKITDFFDVRRSSRKPAKQIENERIASWRKLIREECIDGYGIFTSFYYIVKFILVWKFGMFRSKDAASSIANTFTRFRYYCFSK